MSIANYCKEIELGSIPSRSGSDKLNSTHEGGSSAKTSLTSPQISWRYLSIVSTSITAKIAKKLSIDISPVKQTYLINNVSGEITGGLTGIFGPSGSGKTTFLNALARRLDPLRLSLSGDTQINDQPYTYNDLKSFSGYVEQVIIQLLLFSSGNRLIINTVKNT